MSEVTQILERVQQGDPKAGEELLPLVYGELRKLPAHEMANEAPGHTYALSLRLDPAQQTASVRPIATLDFLAVSNGHSAIALGTPPQLLAGQSGGPMVTNGVATRGRVIIVSLEPILDIAYALPLQLTLYGQPG